MNALYDTIAGHEAGEDVVRYKIPKGVDPNGRTKYEPHVGRLPRAQGEEPDYSKFPYTYVGYPVSKAGGPQFDPKIWDDVQSRHQTDVKDFSLPNRRKAFWYAASEAYFHQSHGRDLAEDIKDPANYPTITRNLVKTWPSLPGGGPQQRQTQPEFNQGMADNRRKYVDPSAP